jgi:tripartite-type tricarboxylate transporter receptor subunit TctC
MRSRWVLAVCVAVCTAAGAADTVYPTRPVRLIVGYPPGGSTDIAARMIGQRLAPTFQQTVVIDNRAGASGQTRAVNRGPLAGCERP